MGNDLTVEWIARAQRAPEEDYYEYTFLTMIAGGNLNPRITQSLTNLVLREILCDLDRFGDEEV